MSRPKPPETEIEFAAYHAWVCLGEWLALDGKREQLNKMAQREVFNDVYAELTTALKNRDLLA
jgi:hypothetical protein